MQINNNSYLYTLTKIGNHESIFDLNKLIENLMKSIIFTVLGILLVKKFDRHYVNSIIKFTSSVMGQIQRMCS